MAKGRYADQLDLPCGARLKSRLSRSAMTESLADTHDAPNKAHQTLCERWSHGGMAMQMTGNVMVDRRYLERPGNVVVEDERVLDALQAWAQSAKSGGSQIWMQISHPGRQCPIVVNTRPLSPSAQKLRILGLFGKPREMTSEDIEDAIQRYAKTARSQRRRGLTACKYMPRTAISSVNSCRRSQTSAPTHGVGHLKSERISCARSLQRRAQP